MVGLSGSSGEYRGKQSESDFGRSFLGGSCRCWRLYISMVRTCCSECLLNFYCFSQQTVIEDKLKCNVSE